jgi:protein SCO1/2
MIRRKTLFLILLGALALATGSWLGQWFIRDGNAPPLTISGIYFPEPKAIRDIDLIQQNGQPLTQDDFKGQWSFLYFGYTYCPDICPMTLVELNKVEQLLAQRDLSQHTAYMLISLDPQRDTPRRLQEYTTHFNPKFRGVTGSADELAKLAKQCGVAYRVPEHAKDDTTYYVDHSSTVILIDPDAHLRAVFTPPQISETLVADFLKIREHYQQSH